MSVNIPQLIFKYAYPLDGNRRQLFEEKDLGEYPTIGEVEEGVEMWKALWAKYNKDDRVMKKIIELTGLVYPQDIIAFVIGGGLNPMSTPLILPVQWGDDTNYEQEGARKELITHEILHLFVGDQQALPELREYWNAAYEKYAGESDTVKHHVIIYALLIKIFDAFLPDMDVGDFIGEDWEDYARAYEIACEEGADTIITDFRRLTEVG